MQKCIMILLLATIQNDLIKNTLAGTSCMLLAGLAYAGLGKDMNAIREGELAVKMVENNKMAESEMKFNLAAIYNLLG